MDLHEEAAEYIWNKWQEKNMGTEDEFDEAYRNSRLTPPFKINENVFDKRSGWNDKLHFIMRYATGFYITEAFRAMKIDLNDPNVEENLEEGNIGTPQRMAKVWVGANLNEESELGHGRWTHKPRIASFPNTNTNTEIPITKRVDIVSNCSHHGITFSTLARPDSYAIISYIPNEKVLGISKLQRLADWIGKRFWLQEDLTKAIYDEIVKVAETESVYVKIVNAVHGCEFFRGARSNDGAFSSECYGGKFTDPEMRKQVDRSI